jgi:hypothetical protein
MMLYLLGLMMRLLLFELLLLLVVVMVGLIELLLECFSHKSPIE